MKTPKQVLAGQLAEWDTDYEADACAEAIMHTLDAAGYVIVPKNARHYDDGRSMSESEW